MTPAFLLSRLPPLASDVNPYHRRRPFDRRIPICRTEQYKSSFFPSTTNLWNSLPQNMQTTTSLSQFKSFLKATDSTIPPYYYIGDRHSQIHHTRLRLNMSDLNSHLVSRYLSEDSKCSCGHRNETPYHFFFECPNYDNERSITINHLPTALINLNLILHGDRNLSIASNSEIVTTVLTFIALSKRFA